MKVQTGKGWTTKLLPVIIMAIAISSGNVCKAGTVENSDAFEKVRSHIQTWLSKATTDKLLISTSSLKDKILNDWERQKGEYEIVSVRKPDDYNKAGHIPHAVNIYWVDVINDESLSLLDPNKTLILYCYYGHGSMLSSTILSLLGYDCRSLNFGMMGWNLGALVKDPWDQKADYDIEIAVNKPIGSYPPPVITCEQRDAKSMIKEMARRYLSGEGSPVIVSADVKAILDDWDKKEAQFQIVDVRSKRDYIAGHVPHSLNIPWKKIAEASNLKKLDPGKTIIVYSENGQIGQLASTVLSLLGYKAVDMKFGMMDWNKSCVDRSEQWNGAAGYPVETSQP